MESEINKINTSVINNTDQVDKIFNQLVDLEDKCNTLEQRELEKQTKEITRINEIHRQQLDIENEKITHLKDVVKFYNQQYKDKLKINKKCRSEISKNLDNETEFIQNNLNTMKDNSIKLNLGIDQITNLVN